MTDAYLQRIRAPLGDRRGFGGLILGIESSCDETAAAVVERGSRPLSNVVASQIAIHSPYGGVVPELASREHLRAIVPVVDAALREAGVASSDVDAIAVTEGPGLAGALLVGIGYAKALAYALGKPLIAVNHLEGHIHAVLLEHAAALPTTGPLLALVVSGGHTHLYLSRAARSHLALPQRRPHRRRCRRRGLRQGRQAARPRLPRWPLDRPARPPRQPRGGTLLLRPDQAKSPIGPASARTKLQIPLQLQRHQDRRAPLRRNPRHGRLHCRAPPPVHAATANARRRPPPSSTPALRSQTLDLLASFQRAVVDDLKRKTFAAAEHYGAHGLLISGGVAANRELRARFTAAASERGLPIAFPALALSTDNAAMIAAAAWPKLLAGDFAPPSLSARPTLPLGQ